ncbi:MAG: quercetin 2,3-dioxygenase [Candidatus Rokubacteria bacterium 13_1_40CM_68_15]|nr:MAG: quercetin 2,3-dioxygenase [Candidatus Rokubacteria bacterium 13_1_40CM_68_15]
MITKRAAGERGHFDHGWLQTYHTFSFADYHDPDHMGFRHLRVINEDYVRPGMGFPTHGHRDMEIVTCVLEGALEHRDSLGNGSVIRPNDVQRMTAGTGVRHSEFNASKSEPVHLLQIWIMPARAGLAPGYEQKTIAEKDKRGALRLIASPDGDDGSVTINQDVRLSASVLQPGEKVAYDLPRGRFAWLQVARGAVTLNGQTLVHGDGAAVSDETSLGIAATASSEILLFDLA